MCSDPLTVGGGVSIEKTSARSRERSKRYVPSDSHRRAHRSPRPSRLGLSGTRRSATGVGSRFVARRRLSSAASLGATSRSLAGRRLTRFAGSSRFGSIARAGPVLCSLDRQGSAPLTQRTVGTDDSSNASANVVARSADRRDRDRRCDGRGVARTARGRASNRYLGSLANVALNRPIVGIAATPSGQRLLARRRRRRRLHLRRRAATTARPGNRTLGRAHRRHRRDTVRATATGSSPPTAASSRFGDAQLLRLHRRPPRSPRRSSASPDTRSGHGYWLVAADGGVFTLRRRAVLRLHRRAPRSPHRSSASRATPSGHGYWLAAADGGVFTLRRRAASTDRRSVHAVRADRRHLDAVRHGGYWLAAADGSTLLVRRRARVRHAVPRRRVVRRAGCQRGRHDRGVTEGRLLGRVAVRHRRRVDPPRGVRRAPRRRVATKTQAPTSTSAATSTTVAPPSTASRTGLIAFQLVIRMNAERKARHMSAVRVGRAARATRGTAGRARCSPPTRSTTRTSGRSPTRPTASSRRSARTSSAAPDRRRRRRHRAHRPHALDRAPRQHAVAARVSSSGSAPRAAAASSWSSRTSRSRWALPSRPRARASRR